MSELFASNEKLFLEAFNRWKSKIEDNSYQTKGAAGISEGKSDMADSEGNLRQMEIELAVLNAQTKAELQPKVRKYRAEFDQTKRDFMKMVETLGYQKDKEFIMGAHIDDSPAPYNARLLSHEDRIRKQNTELEGAKKVAYETHGVAHGIEINLGDQNIRAAESRTKVRGMQGLLGESEGIISRMLRREMLTKYLLRGIVIILVLALLFIFYYKLFK